MTSKRVASNSVLSNDTTLPLAFCHLFILWNIQQFKLFLPPSLNARHHFSLIASERDIFLVDIPVAGFQFLNQSAFRHPAMALQSENAHVIAQNAQKQCIILKLPERITTLSKVTPQQRISLCLAQVLGQCLPRKQAMPVTDVRHLSPMPTFRPFDELHGLIKQRIRHFPLSLGKSGGGHKRHKHSGRQPAPGPPQCPERCFPHHSH